MTNVPRRPALIIGAAAIATLVLCVLSIALGSVSIPVPDVMRALFASDAVEPGTVAIVRLIRVPRTLSALGTGAALGLSGLLMQTVFRNPLAGPGVLGVTSGAGLGVAIVLLAGVGGSIPGIVTFAALIGAGAVLGLALVVNRAVGQAIVLLVLGLLFGYAASSITTLLMAANPSQGLERYIVWSFGSFALPPGPFPHTIVPIVAAATLCLTVLGPRIDALLLGASYAESSGMHARRSQGLLIMVAGILTGITTAATGPIGFLGVAIPHLARGVLRRSQHRVLVPATAILGAGLAVAADLVARVPGSSMVLPLNAVTAVIGVPVVVMTIARSARAGNRMVM